MKITALYNARGVIVAGVAVNEEPGYDGPALVPVASRGTKLGVFDVPESLYKARIDEICTAVRVDVRSQRLIEVKALPARRTAKPATKARKPAKR
jgi:hypothetical protein